MGAPGGIGWGTKGLPSNLFFILSSVNNKYPLDVPLAEDNLAVA